MAYIRRIKTSSGATAVQIAYKLHGEIIKIEHIGSAHSTTDLVVLVAAAKQRLRGSQQSLFPEAISAVDVVMKQPTSRTIYTAILDQAHSIGNGIHQQHTPRSKTRDNRSSTENPR